MLCIVAFVFVAFVVITFLPRQLTFIHRPRFINHWSERFRGIESLDTAKQMDQKEPVFIRTFPSGEWIIATCEHSCCSGAGFDATVIRDSAGTIYTDTTHTFCGIEGMSSTLSEYGTPATSLTSFYSGLSMLKLEKQ